MSFWDDLVKNVTGQSNAPAQRSSGALRKAAPRIERQAPARRETLTRGGGGGGMQSMSVSTPRPTGRGGRTDEEPSNPLGEFGNFLRDAFTPKEIPSTINQDIKDKKDEVDATWSTERDVGDRLPAIWDNTPLEGIARPLVTFDADNKNDAAALAEAKRPTRDELAANFGSGQSFEVRQLSQEEWDQLDLKTQQAITANYALYQATQADKAGSEGEQLEGYDEAVNAIFGAEGGSDTYAPNTIRVLSELGYTNDNNDLDYFLQGSAILGEKELLGEDQSNMARMSVLEDLTNSTAWQNSNLVPMLEEGNSLLDSLRQGDALSADTLRLAGVSPMALYDIDPERTDALNGLMQGMASRDLWDAFGSDAEASNSFKQDFDHITSGLDPALVSRYFRETYPQYFQNAAYGDANRYMTPDEFYANWLS
ncbi:hypothetical protein SEA_CRUNCHYBOI_44 [Microbacterium phage CrunchyBoi]|nr:hypothetical protein SEA_PINEAPPLEPLUTO_44 [Microbacterium phage PineapplePluto]QQO39387.1 hypothetical protein SEA_CRUNCHYBOI_44 [Microbacterium phage CrunchyBoi]